MFSSMSFVDYYYFWFSLIFLFSCYSLSRASLLMLTNIQDIQGNLTFIEIAKVTLYLEELSLKICIYVHVSLLFSETVEVVLTR